MKKQFILASMVAIAALMLSSCSTTEKLPRYVSVEKVISLELGSSYKTVVTHFNSEPYDLVCRQKDGVSIYVYKYRIFHREIKASEFDKKGHEVSGESAYYGDLKNLYLFFKDDKLYDIQTDDGLTYGANWVMINNTLYNISDSGDGYNTNASPLPTPNPKQTSNAPSKNKLFPF